jgi:hypothetical protein
VSFLDTYWTLGTVRAAIIRWKWRNRQGMHVNALGEVLEMRAHERQHASLAIWQVSQQACWAGMHAMCGLRGTVMVLFMQSAGRHSQ